MALLRNRSIFARGIERIDVRNLIPPCDVEVDRFSPAIEVLVGHAGNDEKQTIFQGEPQMYSCNPSWNTLSGLNASCFVGDCDITHVLVRFRNGAKFVEEDNVFLEIIIDIGKLIHLENLSLSSLSSFQKNSILFWVDDKTLLMENSLYISLRKSKQIKARSGSIAYVDDKLVQDFLTNDNDEDQQDAGVLSEMNSILMDEDEKNISLRKDIENDKATVSSLRTDAESLLENVMPTNGNGYTALQHLELQELRSSVEKAEAAAIQEEELLRLKEEELLSVQDELKSSLRRWNEITNEKCNSEATNEIIERKRNELIHSKFLLDARRLKLFGELSNIYPITRSKKNTRLSASGRNSNVSSQDDDAIYSIRGAELPFIIDNSLKDDEQVSTALGYIVHILLLSSKYLQLSLRYEVLYNSSRSMIRDAALGRGSTLPLFKRGVERERFDRALIWLQRDLEQLMDYMGHKYLRSKSLLHNLKYLFDCEICPKLLS